MQSNSTTCPLCVDKCADLFLYSFKSWITVHTKHILFCTILVFYILFQEYVFKYVWIFFSFCENTGVLESSFHPLTLLGGWPCPWSGRGSCQGYGFTPVTVFTLFFTWQWSRKDSMYVTAKSYKMGHEPTPHQWLLSGVHGQMRRHNSVHVANDKHRAQIQSLYSHPLTPATFFPVCV